MTQLAAGDAMRELELSEARYRTLVLATALDVWRTDAKGRLVSDMPNWREHTSQDEGALEGWGWLDGVHPDHRERVRATWSLSTTTGDPYECEYPIVGPDGVERIVLARGYPIMGDGAVLEWIGVATDVTRQRQAERRLADLQRLTAGLAAAQGVADVADLLVSGGATALRSDRASLYIVEADQTHARLTAAIGFDTAYLDRFERIAIDEGLPGLDALRSGTIVVLRSPEEWSSAYPELTDSDRRSIAVIAAPLSTGDRAFGVITFGWDEARDPGEDEVQLVESLADLAAQALDRARLYELERETSLTLQRSLLPPRPPAVPGMEVATRYRPGVHAMAVGGDFFDVFSLGPNAWGVTIGDVCGKGAAAAGLTALARYSLRAAAIHHVLPSDVLRELNGAVLNDPEVDGRFCSAVYVRLELDRCGSWVTIASGGHPRPYVVRRAGWVDLRAQCGMLLGLFDDPDISDDLVGLGPGDSLVLLTDGITEARGPGGEMFGEEGLPDVLVEGSSLTAEELADVILTSAEAFAGGNLRDDAAIVVLRVPLDAADDPSGRLQVALGDDANVLPDYPVPLGDPGRRPLPPREARTRLPARLDSVATARRFVEGVLHSWRLSSLTGGDAELLVSELTTNAVRHGESDFTVIVGYDGTRVRVEVGDGSRLLPELQSPYPDGTGGRGLLLVDRLAAAWGAATTASGKRVWFELPIPARKGLSGDLS